MQTDEARYPAPSGRFFLLLLILGGVVGLVLLLIGAPFWLFYAAPVLMAPLVVWELRSLESVGSQTKQPSSKNVKSTASPSFLGKQIVFYDYIWASLGPISLIVLAGILVSVVAVGISGAPLFGLSGGVSLVILGVALISVMWRLAREVLMLHVHELSAYRASAERKDHDYALAQELDRAEVESQRAEAAIERASADARRARAKTEKLRARRAERDMKRRRQVEKQRRRRKHVVKVEPADGEWIVRRGPKTNRFSRKSEAQSVARRYLLRKGGGVLIEVDEDGSRRHTDVTPSKSDSSDERLTNAVFAGGEELDDDGTPPSPRRKPRPK